MADTPEQRLDDMANAIAHALTHLRTVAQLLPIPIDLPIPGADTPPREFIGAIERLRTLIEDEPIPGEAMDHLDQATLSVLTAIDLIQIALADGIDWRYEAVHMICTTSILASHLTLLILRGNQE
ncbi:hypothetical protein [Nonomuraea sp. NPDC049709]|uniref:hypothetical protein n=1 Tax=Nonomuraea sp. NPDC049709 TaxID=3154736 RepID=UPI00341DC4C2